MLLLLPTTGLGMTQFPAGLTPPPPQLGKSNFVLLPACLHSENIGMRRSSRAIVTACTRAEVCTCYSTCWGRALAWVDMIWRTMSSAECAAHFRPCSTQVLPPEVRSKYAIPAPQLGCMVLRAFWWTYSSLCVQWCSWMYSCRKG